MSTAQVDRRARRRERTRVELLDAAEALMAEEGVATLSLAAAARRVGLSQPSAYTYFASRTAVFDALFERGMARHRDRVATAIAGADGGWPAATAAMRATVELAAERPALAQLLFHRPVPGFTPSEEAYAPAVEVVGVVRGALAEAAARGQLHPDAATEAGLGLLVVLTAGVTSQVLANEPGVPLAASRWAALLEPALSMYAAQLAPDGPGLDLS